VIYEFGSIVSFVSTRSVLLISESGNEIISIFLRQDKYMFRWCHDFLEKMRDSYNGEFFLAYLGCTLGSTGYVSLSIATCNQSSLNGLMYTTHLYPIKAILPAGRVN
jgi:hypothetical protein